VQDSLSWLCDVVAYPFLAVEMFAPPHCVKPFAALSLTPDAPCSPEASKEAIGGFILKEPEVSNS
jgi:hypothetical protein